MPARLPAAFALALTCSPLLGQTPSSPAEAPPETFPGESSLANRIATLLNDPAVSRAHWGIAVTALDGTPIYSLNETKLFRPASTAKLFTTAAAISVLGPEHTVITALTGDLDPATGVLHGDLSLVGGGDPSFGTNDLPYGQTGSSSPSSNDLVAFADQIVAKGLRHITGDIVGNDALFGREPPPEGWAAEDLLWGYGALPSALSFHDNEVRLTISKVPLHPLDSDMAQAPPPITVDQLTPYLQVQNELVVASSGTKAAGPIGITRIDGHPDAIKVFGTIAPGSPAFSEHIAIEDPARYAATALRQLLLDRGVQVDGEARPLHTSADDPEPYLAQWRKGGGCGSAYPGEAQNCASSCLRTPHSQQQLAAHISAPLAEDISFTLKTSANLHAELLVRQLGLQNSCPGSSAANGARLIRTFLLHVGLADGDFVFYDGSGLSTKNLVTPRAEAQLLAYATKQPWFPQWKAALPVGGADGTLAGRFTDPTLKGHVFAKTGTLGESRALAGYVQCASGTELIFSILDDNHEPGSSADRTTMDKIVEAIAAAN